MREKTTFFTALTVLFLIWFVGLLIPLVPSSSATINQTVLTELNVTNTDPKVYNVTVYPSLITLTPGGLSNVTCNATIWDYNGVPSGIEYVEGNLYLYGTSISDAIKNDTHYYSNCTNTTYLSSTTSIYTCVFEVRYFARNGTWNCNVTAIDKGYLNNSNANITIIAPLLAINVSDKIDYGNVPALNTSDERDANISNFGNIPMNITVRGWGGENESLYSNLSMICEYGNISIEYERYNISSGLSWDSMYNLTGTDVKISGLTVDIRNDTYIPYNKTYWRIKVPTGVGGYCNGTIMFTATNL